jgi:hypothetical protein
MTSMTVLPAVANYSKTPRNTRALMHQIFGHISDDVLDAMCKKQTIIGLPKVPPPRYQYSCPICALGKMTQVPKGKIVDTGSLSQGELLHIDFAFWYISSRRGFTSMLVIIDAKTRKLWVFCTAIKKPPLHILRWLFSSLLREKRNLSRTLVDKDGLLIGSSALCRYIRDREGLILKHTGGYASYLNGKVECPNRTLAERARCVIINADSPKIVWCYAVKHCADIYCVTLHSAIDMSLDEAWYGTKDLCKDMHIWGCRILGPTHDVTKSHDRAGEGYFYGYAKL